MDLTATILAVAHATTPPSHPLDGINLIPLLQKNSDIVKRTFFWLGPQAGSLHKAIRDGRWKYINDLPVSPGMLFDVQADPGERNEVGARYPDTLRKLKAKHANWEATIRPLKTTDSH